MLLTFCAIWSGLVFAENITDNVLPLTLRRFTVNASVIGLILASKPLFGFVAQPLVGVWSDRIATPLGRRTFFLIACAPLVAICLVLIPALAVFWQLIIVVVAFQFFQDIAWGSDHPLMADIVPVQFRTLLMSMIMTANQLITFLFLNMGMGWCMKRFGEPSIYWIGALAEVAFVSGAALLLKKHESPPVPGRRPALTPRRYVRDILGDRVLRKFALLAFCQGVGKFIILAFVVLFATNTVGLSREAYGKAWSWQSLTAPFLAIPIGVIVERCCPKNVTLATGYLIALAGCIWGMTASRPSDFIAINLLFGTGMMIVEITQKPFFTEYLPKDIIGQLTGAYNVCFATGRTLATAGGGLLIMLCHNNFRVIWYPGALFVVIATVISLMIADDRYRNNRTAHRACA